MYLPDAECKIYDENGTCVDSVRAAGYKKIGLGNQRISNFDLLIPRKEGIYKLEFIYPEFDTLSIDYQLMNIGKREESRNVGTVYLSRHQEYDLKEVTVKATKVKFYYKGDTIIYNADAFNLSEGSMLDALISELPGVKINEEGQIYVNGRYIESLLLNGKEFFKGNNQLMLNNLSAYTVKNVQVYEKQTDINQFVDNTIASDKQYVMDVKLKQEFETGTILNIEGGGGFDDRYTGRIFVMHFQGDNRFTLIGNLNNLSKTSRTTKNSSYFTHLSPTKGESTIYDGGFDYNISNGASQFEGDAYVTGTKSKLRTTLSSTEYAQDAETHSYSKAHNLTKDLNIQTRHKLTHKTNHVFSQFEGTYKFQKNDGNSQTASIMASDAFSTKQWSDMLNKIGEGDLTLQMRDSLINQSLNLIDETKYKSEYSFTGAGTIKFDRTPDWISWTIWASYNNWHSQSLTERLINYGDSELQGLGERQRKNDRPNNSLKVETFTAYNYKPKSNMLFTLGYDFSVERQKQNSNLFTASILADATGRLDILALRQIQETFAPNNSYTNKSDVFQHTIYASFSYNPNRNVRISSTLPFRFISQYIDYVRGEVSASPSRHSFGLNGTPLNIYWITKSDYNTHGQNYLTFKYDIATQKPDLVKTIDIIDDIDPLNVFLGNKDLKNSWRHSFETSYFIGVSNIQTFQLSAEANFINNDLVSGFWLDPASGKRLFKTYNVDGNLDLDIYVDYWRELSSKFSYRGILRENYYRYSGMYGEGAQQVSQQKSHMFETSMQQGIKFSSSGHRVGITLHGTWKREETPNNKHYDMFDLTADLETKFRLTSNLELTNDFYAMERIGYTDNSLNKFYPLWNASLTYRFDNGKWLIGVHAYDILNKMDNVVSSIDANSRTITYFNYIPRYVLATVQFRFNHSPAKHVPEIIY